MTDTDRPYLATDESLRAWAAVVGTDAVAVCDQCGYAIGTTLADVDAGEVYEHEDHGLMRVIRIEEAS